MGRADRTVSDSEPGTDNKSRPRVGRLLMYIIWPTALKIVVSRIRRSASRSKPELKSGLGTGSSGRSRTYVHGERFVMMVRNKSLIGGWPSRSSVRAGQRRSV